MSKISKLHLYAEPWDGDPGAHRDTFIGGSDVGTILGVNPYKSAYQLYLEKTGEAPTEDISDKLQVRLGHKMEQIVAELYTEQTGNKVNNSLKTYRCKEFPYLGGHIDRRIVGQRKGLEIKTTSSHNRSDYAEGEIPPSHYYQCLFYMLITGWHDWDIATLRDNNGFYIVHVPWNEEEAEYMLERLQEFWECVQNKKWTLPIDGLTSTASALNKAYPESTVSKAIAIDAPEIDLETYFEAKSTLKKLETLINSVENNIKSCMQDAEHAIVADTAKVTWKTYTRSGGYDIKKFIEEHPESGIEKYKKPDTTYRKFTLKAISGGEQG